MWSGIPTRKVFVVCCKRCKRQVPAKVDTFPEGNIVVLCPLCGELRRYRPSEVYLGRADHPCKGQRSLFR